MRLHRGLHIVKIEPEFLRLHHEPFDFHSQQLRPLLFSAEFPLSHNTPHRRRRYQHSLGHKCRDDLVRRVRIYFELLTQRTHRRKLVSRPQLPRHNRLAHSEQDLLRNGQTRP